MKVLWLSHFVPYPATGHGALQRSHNLLRSVAQHHDVDLVCLYSSSERRVLDEAANMLGRPCRSVRPFPRRLVSMPNAAKCVAGMLSLVGRASYWDYCFWSPAAARHLGGATSPTYDVAFCDTVFLHRYLPFIQARRVVMNHHNVESDLLGRRARMSANLLVKGYFSLQASKVRRAEAALGPRVQLHVVVSEQDAERFRPLAGGARILVVPNGVDVAYFSTVSAIQPEPHRLVFAGGMDWFPNRDAMSSWIGSVWPLLASDNPARSMTIIGRSPPSDVVQYARTDQRVRVLGFVPDVRAEVSRAAIYVCPIRVGGGTRLKILDALAMGRPLVASDAGVDGLELEPERHFLRANTPQEYLHQIRRLEQDASLRNRLAREALDLVARRYDWAPIGGALSAAIESVANSS